MSEAEKYHGDFMFEFLTSKAVTDGERSRALARLCDFCFKNFSELFKPLVAPIVNLARTNQLSVDAAMLLLYQTTTFRQYDDTDSPDDLKRKKDALDSPAAMAQLLRQSYMAQMLKPGSAGADIKTEFDERANRAKWGSQV